MTLEERGDGYTSVLQKVRRVSADHPSLQARPPTAASREDAKREGVHAAELEWASVNTIHSEAIRSKFGVLISDLSLRKETPP